MRFVFVFFPECRTFQNFFDIFQNSCLTTARFSGIITHVPAVNRQKRCTLENQVDHLLPKALYTDNVLNSVSCYTTTQIAKELGITAQELNRQLCALHIQYYQSGQYLLYADYAHMGLAKSRTRYSTLPDPHCDGAQEKLGTAYTHTYLVWTERGRKFIHLKVKSKKSLAGGKLARALFTLF